MAKAAKRVISCPIFDPRLFPEKRRILVRFDPKKFIELSSARYPLRILNGIEVMTIFGWRPYPSMIRNGEKIYVFARVSTAFYALPLPEPDATAFMTEALGRGVYVAPESPDVFARLVARLMSVSAKSRLARRFRPA
ncbi:MAG: hypothetical protein Q8Q41_04530 [bacterium]|nr:hypothetical protein [bacterium]